MSLTFVHTGDGHVDADQHGSLNPETGVNRAWESHLKTIANGVTEAIDRKVDAFLHNGDAFKTGRPSQEAVLMLAETLRPLLEAGIPVVLEGGNHDLFQVPLEHRTATETLGEMLKQYGEIHVVEREPRLVRTSTGLQIAALPWLSKTRVLHALGAGDVDAVRGDQLVAQYFLDKLGEISEEADPTAPFVLASHVTVDDVRIDSLAEGARRGSEVDIAHVFTEPIVSRRGIEDSPVSYAGLSHIHARQRMGTKCFYAGSPDRFTMTDADDPKSMNFVTISDTNELERVEHFDTGARPMHSISLMDDDAEDRLAALEPGALVRLELPPGESMAPESIRKAVSDAGATVAVTKTTPKERKKSSATVLPEKIDPAAAVRAWLKKEDPEGVDADYAITLTNRLMEG